MLGTANIKVRPLRFAMLVDGNSASQVRAAIQFATSQWGGVFFPILTLYKRMPKSWRSELRKTVSAQAMTLGYIDAFDPDFLVQFCDSVPQYVTARGLSILKPEQVWPKANSDSDGDPVYGISVFDVLNEIYTECFKYKRKYPIRFVVPKLPKQFDLFWASACGELPPSLAATFDEHYAESLEAIRPTASAANFFDISHPDAILPRHVTSWALNRSLPRFGTHAYAYFMDASKVDDVVDFWNLRAMGRTVLPLPKQFLREASFVVGVEKFLIDQRREWTHQPGHFDVAHMVRSRHSTMDEMEAFAHRLKLPAPTGGGSGTRFFGLQHWYPRVWDEWARSRDGAVVEVHSAESESIDITDRVDLNLRLKPLLPKLANPDQLGSRAVCANELDLSLYGAEDHLAEVYPKAPGEHLNRAISGFASLSGEWRVGRSGLVKMVRRGWIDTRTVPQSEEIFFAWLADRGWKAELSSPGILAKQIYRQLKGRARLLADKRLLGLLEFMNGGNVNRNGEPAGKKGVDIEREVSVAEVKSRLKGVDGRRSVYETWLELGVFKLGLKAKCPNCQRSSWFALSALSEALDCPRCLSAFKAAGTIDQVPNGWHYRTTGPFSVPNYADGSFAVLLTLDMLANKSFLSLRTTSVPSFTATGKGDAKLEADFAMFWQERFGDQNEGLLFGESKTYGLFEKKDFDRMQLLAGAFPGAVIVFSTLRSTLTKPELVAMTQMAKRGRKYWKSDRPVNPVLILTGAELLSDESPPYCWGENDRKRFDRPSDLLSLCNVSQQLYLGLPAWHVDWSEKFKKRNALVSKD